MKKDISIILFLILAATAMAQTADDSDSIRQYTNWSIVAGPNICGYRHNLSNTDDAPDRITPSVGADAGTAISYHITTKWQLRLTALACLERDKLQRDDVRALMQQLVEGVLAVCTGLTEDNGAGKVFNGLAEAVYGFTVRFHVSLLKMCREAA